MTDKFRNKYRIPSARATFWDYRWNAAYFVTICTHNREHFFGEIKDAQMHLSEIGRIALDCWEQIPDHFSGITLGNHVIMPNHMHGIIVNDNPNVPNDQIEPIAPVETLHATSPLLAPNAKDDPNTKDAPNVSYSTNKPHIPDGRHGELRMDEPLPAKETLRATSLQLQSPKNEKMALISPKTGSLSAVVRSYKSAVSNFARRIHADFAWQTRFHEHIIRNENAFHKISAYILNNPLSWYEDTFYDNKPLTGEEGKTLR